MSRRRPSARKSCRRKAWTGRCRHPGRRIGCGSDRWPSLVACGGHGGRQELARACCCVRAMYGQAVIFSLFWLFVGARVAPEALWGSYATPGHLWGPCGTAEGEGKRRRANVTFLRCVRFAGIESDDFHRIMFGRAPSAPGMRWPSARSTLPIREAGGCPEGG